MNPDEIVSLIEGGMPGAEVTVTGEGGKYEATIISSAFEGLNTVKKHQLVYKIVNEHIASGAIHAISLKCQTPT